MSLRLVDNELDLTEIQNYSHDFQLSVAIAELIMKKMTVVEKKATESTSTFMWLMVPSQWSVAQKVLAVGAFLIALAVVMLWVNNWRQTGALDVLTWMGAFIVAGGVCICLIHRYKDK